MPARWEKIFVLPDQSGRPCLIRDFPQWWDRGAFFERFRDRELDLGNPVDWNLAWLLSAAEAVMWDEQRKAAFAAAEPRAAANLTGEMAELGAALRQATWVVIESSEWESGLS